MSVPDPFPIVVSRSIGAIARAYDGSAPDGVPTLPLHAALLRFAPDSGFDRRELPARSRLSSRASKVAVGAAERRGWVTVEADPDRPRRPAIRFTPAGVDASTAAAATLAAVDDEWQRRSGDAAALRRAAESLVGAFDLELPHHPISYGSGDPTITGGAYARRADPDPRVPPHGADWRPVLRTDPSSAVGLPIASLLSQVLVQFTIEYERGGGVNLHAATRVLRHIGDNGVPLATVADEGITGEGKSYLERHGVVQVGRSPAGDERQVRLTPTGARLRDAYAPLTLRIEGEWRARYGDAVIDTLTTELAARRSSWSATDERGASPDDHVVVGLTAAGG